MIIEETRRQDAKIAENSRVFLLTTLAQKGVSMETVETPLDPPLLHRENTTTQWSF